MNFAFTFYISCFIGLTLFGNANSKKSVNNVEQNPSRSLAENVKQNPVEDESDLTQEEQNYSNRYKDNLAELDEDDYPSIPQTGFSCAGKVNWQYYADIETDCQVFHVCESQFSKTSFLCPEGTVFNQRHLVCDWSYNVDCTDGVDLYISNNDVDGRDFSNVHDFQNRGGLDLKLASSGGNRGPHSVNDAERKSAKNPHSEAKSNNRQREYPNKSPSE